MQLIVITQDKNVEEEAGLVNRLFAAGLRRLHIRKPSFDIEEYRQYINAVDKKYRSRLVISACFELWGKYNLGGIHLNSHIRNKPEVWQAINHIPPAAISTSFHSWQEVADNVFPYAYVFISPVFDSISKQGYKAGIDISKAKLFKDQIINESGYCPGIIGLGGVGEEQLTTLYMNYFDGAAMLGGIWMVDDPVAAYIKARQTIDALANA